MIDRLRYFVVCYVCGTVVDEILFGWTVFMFDYFVVPVRDEITLITVAIWTQDKYTDFFMNT